MICGAARQARWFSEEPRFAYPHVLLERIARLAFPNSSVVEVTPLREGLRNANFRIKLNCVPDSIVIRVYQHDFSLCKKEIDVMRLIGSSVPVPELIHAEPNGWDNLPPFALFRHIEGISFRELKRAGDASAVAQAAHSVGETVAAIGRVTFRKSGWLAAGLSVVDPHFETANQLASFIDDCLESPSFRERVPLAVRKGISAFAWSLSPRLAELGPQTHLVHGDFGKRNIMVRRTEGCWKVAAILDWEFALSGTPLVDLGHFLRYERTSHSAAEAQFSAGYLESGGKLPLDWRQLARLIDLTALSESLTHDELPDGVVAELLELVRGTVENPDLS
ncbi:MAG: phosphotransferase [Candidatus Acidiferrum sp.]|jgi:aminoglycoside phosphotransferase (APT) family kinase protein